MDVRASQRNLSARAILSAVLAALALCAVGVGTATAGKYTVWTCRGPEGEPVSAEGWRFSSADAFTGDHVITDGCSAGGSLELALSEEADFVSTPREALGLLTLRAPPDAPIVDYTLWRSIETAEPGSGSYDFAAAVRDRVSEAVTRDRGCSTSSSTCQAVGDPEDPLAPGNELKHEPKIAIEALQLWVACAAPPCEDPPGVAARLRLFGAKLVLDDVASPAAPRLSGSLADAEPVTGPGVLVVESDDRGGGIASTTLSIDGGPPRIEESAGLQGSCEEPYTLPRPCPAGAAHVFVVDTSELAEGEHTATGTVIDAGGNATAFGPFEFTVEHRTSAEPPPPEPPANGTPAVERPLLRLDSSRVEHPVRRAGWITGSLRTTAGTPVAGARLSVDARRLGAGSAPVRALPPVTTSARGRFAVPLRAAGAWRATVRFAPRRGAAPTGTASAVVRSRAALGLARRPARVRRGEPVLFAGRVRGAGSAAAGAVVEVQAIVGGRWRTVATVRTDRRGRYRWRYAFRYVDRAAIFSFRAVVRRTPGWPWPTLSTRPVRVRIDGHRPPARAARGDREAGSRAG